MIKILVHGSGGKMGTEVMRCIEKMEGVTLLGGVDVQKQGEMEYLYYSSFADVKGIPDVIIDFSFHTLVPSVLTYAEEIGCPIVIATTGMTEEELTKVKETSKKVPIFYSANMSVGVALLVDFAKKAAKAFPDADIEIVEAHHNRKVDAPSGTALMLANGIREVRPASTYALGRCGEGKRERNEIGIHALRMANVVGEHTVYVTTATQQLCLKHTAFDRALFAEGAVKAALFMIGKAEGLYNMYDMIYD